MEKLPRGFYRLSTIKQPVQLDGQQRARGPETSLRIWEKKDEEVIMVQPDTALQPATPQPAIGEPEERIVQIPGWIGIPWLRHGFSTRRGGVSTIYLRPDHSDALEGDLNLGWTKDDDPANVAINRALLVESVLGKALHPSPPLLTLRQVHSANSLIVREASLAASFVTAEDRALREADGLITQTPNILLGIQTADCVPVLVVDVEKKIVAALHAGWRGTAARIVEAGVARMTAEFGCRPENMLAAIGPSIGSCCYSVGEEVQTAFAANFSYAGELFQKDAAATGEFLHLDLWEANRRQLLASGISAERISVIGECTGCAGLGDRADREPARRRYFSHRREHGFTGRMMSVIGVMK